jgi:GNAT superfamily N-acetyltransferase
MLVATETLIVRIMRADLAYTKQRMQVIAKQDGNPFGIAIQAFGAATALAASHLPSSRFNRVVGLTPADVPIIPEILAWYAGLGVSPMIEIRPDDVNKVLADALTQHGFHQTSCQASLVGRPVEAKPPDLIIQAVHTPEIMERFLDVYVAGWGFPANIHEGAKANMRGWLGLPNWHLYLAEVDEQPAAIAILFLHEATAYFADTCVHPDFRGRHLQSALLAHAQSEAFRLGADVLCSQASFASTSHRNMERAEFSLLHTHGELTRQS